MKRTVNRMLLVAVGLLLLATGVLWQRNAYLKEERNRYRSNTEALLSDMKRIRIDGSVSKSVSGQAPSDSSDMQI